MSEISVSVVIPTFQRPDYLRRCLVSLEGQTTRPLEIVVVDASPNRAGETVVASFPGVRYLWNERGRGTTATSRAIGYAATTGEVLAFVDDDTVADTGWLAGHISRYQDAAVGGVAGRTLNGNEGEETKGLDAIGRLLPDGTLTGNFAADPGGDVRVDHAIGANMSFRRSVLDSVGGIHDHYPGTCLREESEIGLRVSLAGYSIIFAPDALNRETAGPYAKGQRFDLRYTYFAERNHLVMLSRTVGIRDARFRRYLGVAGKSILGEIGYAAEAAGSPERNASEKIQGIGRGITRAGARMAGCFIGSVQVLRLAARRN